MPCLGSQPLADQRRRTLRRFSPETMSSGPTVRALSFVNGTLLAPRSNPSLACSPCLLGSVALPAGSPSSCCPSKPLQFQPVGRLANLRCSLPLLPGLKGNLCMYTPEITSACCAAMLAGFTPWGALLLPFLQTVIFFCRTCGAVVSLSLTLSFFLVSQKLSLVAGRERCPPF